MNDLIQKFLRHGLAAFAGYLGSQGFAPEGLQTVPILGSTMCFGISWIWSYLMQADVFATHGQAARALAASLASQLVAALAGWLQAHGASVDVADPVAVTLFAANLAGSNLKQLVRPASVAQWVIIASLPLMTVSCVNQQSTESEIARAQASVEAADFIMELARVYWEGVQQDPKQDPQIKAAAQLAFREAEKRLAAERARIVALRASFAPIPLLQPVSEAIP